MPSQESSGQAPAEQLPEYRLEEMTFEMDEEKIPQYKPPKSDDEDDPPGPSQEDGNEAGGGDIPLKIMKIEQAETSAVSTPLEFTYCSKLCRSCCLPCSGTSNGKHGDGDEKNGAGRGKSGAESVMEKHLEKQKRAREAAEAQAKWFDLKKNTSVYVTGLPDDASEAEIAQVCHPPLNGCFSF